MPEFKDYDSKTTLEATDLFPLSENTGVIKVTDIASIAAALESYMKDFAADMMIGSIMASSGETLGYRRLKCEAETIGNTGSGATYAGPQYEALFLYLKAQAGAWGNTGAESWGGGDTIKLPDGRAVGLIGRGSQTINTREKTGPALGVVGEDQMQLIEGSATMREGNGGGRVMIMDVSGAFTQADEPHTSYVYWEDSSNSTTTIQRVSFSSANSPNARTGETTEINRVGVIWTIGY